MILAFENFELDCDLHELRRDGVACSVEPQVFDLLQFLVENRERLVPKDELFEVIWDGRFVSDATLASRVRSARAAIGDNGKRQVLIRTVPRRGFRFVGDVTTRGMDDFNGVRLPDAGPAMLPSGLDKPSIAVLAFANMSEDPGQEFFADGIAEDVITALSRFRSLFVIARNSSFTYKGAAVRISQIARELGVRYVVEGSVRAAGDRVRISAQLIDAASGNHIWADQFDGRLDDVFDLQDQITEKIVVAVEPEVQMRERERARRIQPNNLDAWSLLQRGSSQSYFVNKSGQDEAKRLLGKAVAMDPEFASAFAQLAFVNWVSIPWGLADDNATAAELARDAAKRAASLDPNEPMAHYVLGRLHMYDGEMEMAIGEMQHAVAINSNFVWGHYGLGQAYYQGAGRAEQSLPHFDAALRLSPKDPLRWISLFGKGAALRELGEFDEAIKICRMACQFPDAGYLPFLQLASSLAAAGRFGEAKAAKDKSMQLEPSLTIRFLRGHMLGHHEVPMKSLVGNLRKAGLPE